MPLRFYREGMDAVFGSVDTDELFTTSATVYVRADGADSNDGLSATSAKASIRSAISDAPVNGDRTSRLIVDIGSETLSPTNGINTTGWSPGNIHIRGATDGSGNPAAVLDFSNLGADETAWHARRNIIEFENVEFQNCPSSSLKTSLFGYTSLTNSILRPNSADPQVEAGGQGRFTLGRKSIIEWDGSANGSSTVVKIEDAGAKIFGTIQVTAGGVDNLINIFDGSSRIDVGSGAVLDGRDNTATARCLRIQSPRHCKIGQPDIQNVNTYIAGAGGGSEVLHQDGQPTFTNVVDNSVDSVTYWGPYGSGNATFMTIPKGINADRPYPGGSDPPTMHQDDNDYVVAAHHGISKYVGMGVLPGFRNLGNETVPSQPILAFHDGSDTNSTPAGLYRPATDGSAWVKVEDNTTTI